MSWFSRTYVSVFETAKKSIRDDLVGNPVGCGRALSFDLDIKID